MKQPTEPTIRLMATADLAAVGDFLSRLSRTSRYFRFFSVGDSTIPAELSYLASIDGHDRLAVVATVASGTIVGLARYHRTGRDTAEVAVVVADGWQHHGLGQLLLRRLGTEARRHGIVTLDVAMLGDNVPAIHLFHRLAADERLRFDQGVLEGSIALAG